MTTSTPDQAAAQIEREKFEAWWTTEGSPSSTIRGIAWDAWKAARRELLARQVPVAWQYRTNRGGALGWSEWCTEDKAIIDAKPDRIFPAIFEVRALGAIAAPTAAGAGEVSKP